MASLTPNEFYLQYKEPIRMIRIVDGSAKDIVLREYKVIFKYLFVTDE